jgi:hypothetical protein
MWESKHVRFSPSSSHKATDSTMEASPVVPRSRDPKRPLRSLKSHAKTKSLYSGLSLGSLTSPTQWICTESPEPHPGRVFIGEGQEAGLPILGVNRLDVIQVRGSWHFGIGFYSTVSWPWVTWPELFLIWSPWAKACFAQLWLDQGWDGAFQRRVHTQVMVHSGDEVMLRSVLRNKRAWAWNDDVPVIF